MMKILHIATDDKFIDQAVPLFEKVYPGANEVFIFSPKLPLKYVKLTPDYIETKKSRFFNRRPRLSKSIYKQYDVVVFHSFYSNTYAEIFNVSEETPAIWLGWGGDYYPDLLANFSLYLEKSLRLMSGLGKGSVKRMLALFIKKLVWTFKLRTTKIKAIEKVSVFCPVLPKEYDLVKYSRTWRRFPAFAMWNYGTVEDNLIKGFEGESVTGDAVLVGNSATYTGNHLEAFDLLYKLKINNRKVVTPLSYGDMQLAEKLALTGKEYFADNFEPLIDFMPIGDYIAIIKNCGYVIMNHVRQQGVGNIIIMLYLGARVFVRQENPVYDFFKKVGVVISTVQELEVNPGLLSIPLNNEERSCNRALVSEYWSREMAHERTRDLVERAFWVKGVQSPAVLAETY